MQPNAWKNLVLMFTCQRASILADETTRLEEADIPVVDFVKIDVEGAEENILRNSTYLKKIKYLDIEFHDDLRSLETVSRIYKECFPNHRVMFYDPENAFLEKVSAGLTFTI